MSLIVMRWCGSMSHVNNQNARCNDKKRSLKFLFEIHFELFAQNADYHSAPYWEKTKGTYLNPLDFLKGVYCISLLIFG